MKSLLNLNFPRSNLLIIMYFFSEGGLYASGGPPAMLKWQDGQVAVGGEPGGGIGGGVSDGSTPVHQNEQQGWPLKGAHPTSPQRSLSSHDEGDQEINSNQSLLVCNRGIIIISF